MELFYILIYFQQKNNLLYRIDLINQISKFRNYYGVVLHSNIYPRMDKNYDETYIPWIYGSFSKYAIGINIGLTTRLTAAVTVGATTFYVESTALFEIDMIFWIELEKIKISAIVSSTQVTVVRAQGGTTAVAHLIGTLLRENIEYVDFVVTAHTCKEITSIKVNYEEAVSDFTLVDIDGMQGLRILHTDLRTYAGGDFEYADILTVGKGAKNDSGTLLEYPNDILSHITQRALSGITVSCPTATIDYYVNNGIKFAVELTGDPNFYETLEKISFQSRSIITFSNNILTLKLKEFGSSVKTITNAHIIQDSDNASTLSSSKMLLNYVINYIVAKYGKYKTKTYFNQETVDIYGYRAPSNFMSNFDFINDVTVLDKIVDFIFEFFSTRRREISFSTSYMNCELEIGDVFTLSHNEFTLINGNYFVNNITIKSSADEFIVNGVLI